MSSYNHLTIHEREEIMKLLVQGHSLSQIAKDINRSKSTISRELRRNCTGEEYSAYTAQERYKKRREICRPKKKLLLFPELRKLIQNKMFDHQWSPQQIVGRLKFEYSSHSISYATIYRAIYDGILDRPQKIGYRYKAVFHLRHKGTLRRQKHFVEKSGKFKILHEICDRPAEAENRCRLGDWEADTVLGKVSGACLVTLTDRKSRMCSWERLHTEGRMRSMK